LKESYGFGLSIGPDTFGHGGAYATNMTIDTKRGLITVWMVQNAGSPREWKSSEADFRKWAADRFSAAAQR